MKDCISKLKQGDIVRIIVYNENFEGNLIEAKFIMVCDCNRSVIKLHKEASYTIVSNVRIMSIKKLRVAGDYITNPII